MGERRAAKSYKNWGPRILLQSTSRVHIDFIIQIRGFCSKLKVRKKKLPRGGNHYNSWLRVFLGPQRRERLW